MAEDVLSDGQEDQEPEAEEETEECPECGEEIEEKDPLMGLWMCDNCEIGFNDNGAVIAE